MKVAQSHLEHSRGLTVKIIIIEKEIKKNHNFVVPQWSCRGYSTPHPLSQCVSQLWYFNFEESELNINHQPTSQSHNDNRESFHFYHPTLALAIKTRQKSLKKRNLILFLTLVVAWLMPHHSGEKILNFYPNSSPPKNNPAFLYADEHFLLLER